MGTGHRFLEMLPTIKGPEMEPVDEARHIRKLSHRLWENLHSEYVLSLRKYAKEKGFPHTYHEGDYVHVIEGNARTDPNKRSLAGDIQSLSGRYQVGRIEQIHPGDGVNRVFVVSQAGKADKKLSYMGIAPLFI